MKRKLKIAWLVLAVSSALGLQARENLGVSGGNNPQKSAQNMSLAAACDPGVGRSELNINNVRTTIFTSGDMWWDLNTNPRYEIPKGSNKHSNFSSALWIGGVDNGGNLKVAAMTYRQSGNDFWPGPLDMATATIDQSVCSQYDRHWKVTRAEVEDFIANCAPGSGVPPGYDIPDDIESWPGNGDQSLNQDQYLAPFRDLNNSGTYDIFNCEYPDYDISGTQGCNAQLYGDQTLWWVFNDKGNVHSEFTGGQPIGIEVHAQAFAFATNDEINNMTFYKYKVFNRSSFTVKDCYFGQWVDSDIGKYNDDYVGCDVVRGLGIAYNGDADDDGQFGYGLNPPAAGLDFFQGPRADNNDGIDNDRDGVVDEIGELIIMSKFVYYNNDFSVIGNPENATHVYNYLRGIWKDGTPMVYGGNGYGAGDLCDFMFPGNTDQAIGWGTGGTPGSPNVRPPWDETTVGNTPADRRFLQSAGPFELQPGAVNFVTVGAVWARASNGGPLKSVELLKLADDKAQSLFDNCFRLIEGPRSPDVHMVELPNKLILELNSTDVPEQFSERYSGIVLVGGNATPDTNIVYNFQGYQIYQLKGADVTQTDLDDPDKARLIGQVDIEDAASQLVNRYFDPVVSDYIPVEEVAGENKGIKHTFEVTTDAFATGNATLVNHKTYYFMIIAYANTTKSGVLEPYLPGKKNFDGKAIAIHAGIPHINTPVEGGTDLGADYADGPKLKRIEGQGNGGMVLDITPETEAEILANGFMLTPTYQNGRGPVNIKVVDPLRIQKGDYTLKLEKDSSSATTSGIVVNSSKWSITNNATGEVIHSSGDISIPNEQILMYDKDGNGKITPEERWGFSVNWVQIGQPGDTLDPSNGFLESTIKYSNVSNQWLGFVNDAEGSFDPRNWIRSGTYKDAQNPEWDDFADEDNFGNYENVINGGFAPYRLAARDKDIIGTPAWDDATQSLANLTKLASIDIVITPDKSKWTRACVVETGENPSFTQGGVKKMDLRNHPSVDKNGNTGDGIVTNDPNDADYIAARGMGWFPGYAINLETGERLNIMFGENSFLTQDNGRDLKWNPTSRVFAQNPFATIFGGMHYIYVMGRNASPNPIAPRFDDGANLHGLFAQSNYAPTSSQKRSIYKDAMWVGMPLAVDGKQWVSNEVRIRIRVGKPYAKNYSVDAEANPQNDNYPMYTFNTDDIYAKINNGDAAKRGLDLINIVPNPYYAYSSYERNQIDTRVKITNLPQRATISIFTLNGTLIRRFKKDDPLTSLDWDLKNQSNIPIASGLYIIHIDVPGVGEKVLKWFGVMRPIDLDTF